MDNQQLKEKIQTLIPDIEITEGKQYIELNITPEKLFNTASILKNNSDLSFDYLFCLTGTDLPENCSVTYHLESTNHRHSIVLKTKTKNRDNPILDSVCSIWETADFHEREVYDLVGITFNNHPDMRRIFLDEEDWVGHPLRKDYTDNNIITR